MLPALIDTGKDKLVVAPEADAWFWSVASPTQPLLGVALPVTAPIVAPLPPETVTVTVVVKVVD